MSGPVRLVRSEKGNALDVIDYEINMLRHCYSVLEPEPPSDQETINVYLESYLVHFRALLEFFARPENKLWDTDLSVRRPKDWATREIKADEITPVTITAKQLYDAWHDPISKQLSHCTKPRYELKIDWPIAEMHAELEKVIEAFNALRTS